MDGKAITRLLLAAVLPECIVPFRAKVIIHDLSLARCY